MVSHFSDQWWIETNQEPGVRGGEVAAIAGNVGHGTRFVGCMDQTTDEQNTLYIYIATH